GIRECQGGRIGHASGKEATYRDVVRAKEDSREEPDDEQRGDGDDRGKEHPFYTVPVDESVQELLAGMKPHARKEQDDADLADREIRVVRHIPKERSNAADSAEQDGNEERSARETEPHGRRNARKGDRNATDEHAEPDADKHGDQLCVVQLLE